MELDTSTQAEQSAELRRSLEAVERRANDAHWKGESRAKAWGGLTELMSVLVLRTHERRSLWRSDRCVLRATVRSIVGE